mgnify:CR=1 FL=1
MVPQPITIARLPSLIAGYDSYRDAGDCVPDYAAAQRAVGFFPACCSHVKGFSGPFRLEPWQRDIVSTLFGWVRPDGTRRYREAFIAVPRKAGKSTLIAGLALYALCCDGEAGPEVYCAASTRDQATLVFDPAASMARANKYMRDELVIHESVKRIVHHRSGGFLRAIPADAAASHGFNASAVFFDELHTQPNRDLYDVLKTSQGSRRQPLFVSITTAGHDRHSICWEVWEYARKVRDGLVCDPTFLPVIYETDQAADWQSEDVWRACNPNLGISVSLDFLKQECDRAKSVTAYENTFRNLYLNQWTEQATRWFSVETWDRGSLEAEPEHGAECWGGLDLSATTDLSALVLVFPRPDGSVSTKQWFWCPLDSAAERARRDRVPYQQWIHEGLLSATPGASVDYDRIRVDIAKIAETYNIRSIAIDRWNANQLAHQLEADGLRVCFFGQGFASMSAPAKRLLGLIVDGKLLHGGHPIMRWMASNVAVELDAAGNTKPSKARSTERIDGIVALTMALGVMMGDKDQVSWSESELGL